MSQTTEFLDYIWGKSKGYVYIPIKKSDGTWKPSWPQWPAQREAIFEFISKATAQQAEVYAGPSIYKRKPGANEKLSSDLFKESNVLWAEFDGNAPEDWPGTITPPGDAGPAASDTGGPVPPPSGRIQSSLAGHQHAYWKLDKPITDVKELENRNRTLALELGADNCWDATRVLRPPGTTNYGYGKPERKGQSYPVYIEELTDVVYKESDFKKVEDFRPLVKENLGDIPSIEKVLAQKNWPDSLWEAFNEEAKDKKRSDQLQKVAYECAEQGFKSEEIYAVLINCDDRWEKYKHRTDRERRLVDIIDRAISKHPFALSDEAITFSGLTGSGAGEEFQIKSYYEFEKFLELSIKLTWQLEGILPVGGYGIVAGPTGVGKSQFVIRMGEALASGKNFLNWKNVVGRQNVIFLSLEMSAVEVKQFFEAMNVNGDFLPEGGKDFFNISPIGDQVPLDREEGRKFLEGILEEHPTQILIIDSLSKAMAGDFKNDADVLEFNRYLSRIRQRFGCSIIIVHHNRKSQDKKFTSDELDDLYGSRYLAQDASFVMMLHKQKNDMNHITMNVPKLRFTAPLEKQMLERNPDLSFSYIGGVSDADGQDPGAGLGSIFGGGSISPRDRDSSN